MEEVSPLESNVSNPPPPSEGHKPGPIGSLLSLLNTLEGQKLDSARLIAILALFDVMAVMDTLEGRAAAPSLITPRSGTDNLPTLAANLLTLLQGQSGQKINPGALLNLVNLLGSQLGQISQRPTGSGSGQEESPTTEPPSPGPRSRLDWRRDWRKSGPDSNSGESTSQS